MTLQFHSTTEVANIISQFLTFVTGSPSFPRLCPIFKIERGPARGGSQVACRNFKMLRVGVLSRLTSLSEIKGQLLQFFVTNSRL